MNVPNPNLTWRTLANGDLTASITPRKKVFALCATLGIRGREQSEFMPWAKLKDEPWLSWAALAHGAVLEQDQHPQNMMYLPSSLIGVFCQDDVGDWIGCPPLFIKGLLSWVSWSPSYAPQIWSLLGKQKGNIPHLSNGKCSSFHTGLSSRLFIISYLFWEQCCRMNPSLVTWSVLWVHKWWFQSSWVIFNLITSH